MRGFVANTDTSGSSLNLVTVGPFATRKAAEAADVDAVSERASAAGGFDGFVTRR